MPVCKSVCFWPFLCILALQFAAGSSSEDEGREKFPVKSQFSSVEVDMSSSSDAGACPTEKQMSFAREHISEGIKSQLLRVPEQLIECDRYHIGKVPHCAVSNCSVIFDQLKDESGLILFSGFYWLQLPDQAPQRVYCNRETGFVEVSSCSLLFSHHPTADSGYYILLLKDGVRSEVYCNRETGEAEPESCGHAHQLELPSGHYTLRPLPEKLPLNGTVFCNMDLEECGSNGTWWTHIATLNMTDTSASCPPNWELVTEPVRACSRSPTTASGCDSVRFPSQGHTYSQVCGRVVAHQKGRGFGFWPLLGRNQDSTDDTYLTGVSITHGNTPRTHIWSFAANLGSHFCPCHLDYESQTEELMGSNDFVGQHYFCETGRQGYEPGEGEFDLEDPLWDGATCFDDDICCSFNNPPWFSVSLSGSTSDDVEVRICGINPAAEAGTPISLLDIYVH